MDKKSREVDYGVTHLHRPVNIEAEAIIMNKDLIIIWPLIQGRDSTGWNC